MGLTERTYICALMIKLRYFQVFSDLVITLLRNDDGDDNG